MASRTSCLGSHADEICNEMGFAKWSRVETVGFSGGIWIFWKDELKIEVISTHPHNFYYSVLKWVLLSVVWLLSIVYGSPNVMLRCRLGKILQWKISTERGIGSL